MRAGISTFLVAVPIDVVNHRVNGLDVTSWSPSQPPDRPVAGAGGAGRGHAGRGGASSR